MKMSARADFGIICKPLDFARQMMHIAIVFPTDITGRAKVADVFYVKFEREIWTYVQLNSFQYLQIHLCYMRVRTWFRDGKETKNPN